MVLSQDIEETAIAKCFFSITHCICSFLVVRKLCAQFLSNTHKSDAARSTYRSTSLPMTELGSRAGAGGASWPLRLRPRRLRVDHNPRG
jgi:hypothetical protein